MSQNTKSVNKLRQFLRAEATNLGFSGVAITTAHLPDEVASDLSEFLGHDYHGTMDWMVETAKRRSSPTQLWGEARSVILLAMNYAPEDQALICPADKEVGAISVYAQHRDYHDLIKGRLKTLASKLISRAKELGEDGDVKVFVDTAPVMEKPLAQKAGLGWQGKHTNLVSRQLGSWFFLGSIFTTFDLGQDQPEIDNCGSCRSCLDACPTNAFPAPYQIDARRCISYLTIEHKGPIPHEFRKPIGNRIYGCDDCLAACPWNKFANSSNEIKLLAPDDYKLPQLRDLLGLDDQMFRSQFSGSPVKRIGRNRFIRNCLIAAGNSAQPELVDYIQPHLADGDPVVRGAAVWAMAQLGEHKTLRSFSNNETDSSVLDEFERAVSGAVL
ncbi:MAG: tRNA epoxyqueuosine(34) reductase QueG [Hyphomicrobiales bacterium]|nr:MAG: tRNA epoxyqueuosine(34) reductase QueG [Hyphomicrobiales bacterium]